MSSRTPFFSTPERIAALASEAESWRGTPFRERASVKGPSGGVDCVGYVLACLRAAGVEGLPDDVPEYDPAHGLHYTQSLLLEWAGAPENRARLLRIESGEAFMEGDLLFLKESLACHHLGIYSGRSCWHVIRPSPGTRGNGVTRTPIDTPRFTNFIAAIYRITS